MTNNVEFHICEIPSGIQLTASIEERPLRQAEFYAALANREFSLAFSKQLTALPYTAIFWETPALNQHSLNNPFECVAIEATALAKVTSDPNTFARHFAKATQPNLVRFNNLSGQSTLIAPLPCKNKPYAHLLEFLRQANSADISDLWRELSSAVQQADIQKQTIWVSTSGLGVYWLHLRIDPSPKYYRHAAYK